jgi:hypothetical protein
MIDCLAACLVDFLGLRTKASPSSFTSVSVTGHLSGFIRLQSEPAWFNNLWPDNLVGVFLPNSIRNLLCTITTDFDSWYHSTHLAFWSWDAIFHDCGVRTTGGKTWKNANGAVSTFDPITDLNKFSFNFCASGLISTITLNSPTFLVSCVLLRCYASKDYEYRQQYSDTWFVSFIYDAGYRWSSIVVWCAMGN